MKIQFVDEDLVDRVGLYIDPDQPLSSFLTHVQDGIEAEGIRVDRKFKYVKGKLCKFFIELISENNSELLQKRKKLVETINLNLNKIKWEIKDNTYILHIGKIGDKEIFITVAKFFSELSEDAIETVKEITQKVTNSLLNTNKPEPPKVVYNAPKYTPPPPKPILPPPPQPQKHISNKPPPQIGQHPPNISSNQQTKIKQKYISYNPIRPVVEIKHSILNFKVKEY